MSGTILGTALYLRERSLEGSKQVFPSFVSRPPQEHNAYHPRSTFTRFFLSFVLSWVSHAMVVGDARWMVMDLSLVLIFWCLATPFTRWLEASPTRAPAIPPGKVRSSDRIHRSISPYRLHETW